MTVSRIDHDGISTSIYQCLHTVEGIGSDADTCGNTQTTLLILAGHGLVLGLRDVLIGNQTDQMIVLIHNGQFLDLVLLQDLGGSRQVCLLVGGHEVILRHDFLHRTVQTTLEAQVTVRHDTYKVIAVIDNGDTADMILRHDVEGLSHRRSLGNRDRIIDHTVLSTLDDSHLTGLIVDRHILMDHTDTTFTGNGDSHLRLGDGIHRSCHKRDVQLDVPREAGFQLYCLGQYFRIGRDQQDIVKCQAVHYDFVINK